MAIKEITETLGREYADSQDDRAPRRKLRVIVDSMEDSPELVAAHAAIPKRGDKHPGNRFARVTSVNVRAPSDSHAKYYDVEVEYGIDGARPKERILDDDPLSHPAEIEWRYISTSEARATCYRLTWVDKLGVKHVSEDRDPDTGRLRRTIPIATSAGEPIEPPFEFDVSRAVLVVAQNKPVPFPVGDWANYGDQVNSDDYQIGGFVVRKGQTRMTGIQARPMFRGGIEYIQVSFELHWRREGWARQYFDAGFIEAIEGDGPDGEPVMLRQLIREDSGRGDPISKPVLLDGLGRVWDTDLTPVIMEAEGSDSLPFRALGLPFVPPGGPPP